VHLAAVGAEDLGPEAAAFGERGDGGMAIAAQSGEESALGVDRLMGGTMIDRADQFAQVVSIGEDLGADCALRGRGQQIERDAGLDAEPVEPGGGEQGGVDLAARDPGEAGLDVAADRQRMKVRPPGEQLRGPPRRGGADPGALGQRGDAVGADQPVARIGPLQHRRDCESAVTDRLDVLHRMDRKIGSAGGEPDVKLPGPQCLAAQLGERPILDDVARSRDRHQLDRAAMGGLQRLGDEARLGEGERRSAGADAERTVHSALVLDAPAMAGKAAMSLILGIESSCDETAAALVASDRRILAHRIADQGEAHRPYGGVVPEIAARAHVEILPGLIEAVLAEARIDLAEVDAIAATAGPGLIGGVMVGLVTAKGLALASGKPLIALNHLEGHALSPMLSDPELHFPYLLLLVSGGHCQLLFAEGVGRYRRLATTIDDAAGEAFDKSAKLLGLGFPGGPAVERAAAQGDPRAVPLPRPLAGSDEPHFSFAGLKSAVVRAKESGRYRDADIAASFQQAVVDCLVDRTARAIARAEGATALVVAGGVAANAAIRAALTGLAAAHDLPFVAPPAWLCTDNAAMIAWAGALRFEAGLVDGFDAPARARWPLDPDAEKARGAGVKA